MTRILLFFASFLGAIWERSGPSSDPFGKPTGQGLWRSDDEG